jgi:glutamine synthetase
VSSQLHGPTSELNSYLVTGVDVDGVLRGKVMMKAKFLSAAKEGGFAFCSVTFGWDMHDKTCT